MKVPFEWLKDFVDVTAPAKEREKAEGQT